MHISYLWLKKFRNIEKQGFSFSARFNFYFNYDTGLLSVETNPRYIDGFFGDRVSNVTGLIGQNASGKTNLLEALMYVMSGANSRIAHPFFILIEDKEGRLTGYSYGMTSPETANINFKPYKDEVKDFDAVFISNVFDGRRHNFDKKIKDLSTNNLSVNKFGENFHTLYNKEIQSQVRFVNSDQFLSLNEVDKTLEGPDKSNFYPTHVRLATPSWGNIRSKAKLFDEYVKRQTEENLPSVAKLVQRFLKKMNERISDEKAVLFFTSLLLYLDFLLTEISVSGIESSKKTPSFIEVAKAILFDTDGKLELEGYFETFSEKLNWKIDELVPYQFERAKFLSELKNYNFSNIIREEEGKYNSKRIEFLVPYDRDAGSFITKYINVTTSNSLNYAIEWEGISSGHKAYLSLFSRLYEYYQKKRSDSSNIFLCIDEGDLYFHPKWQTEYLYKLITYLPKLFKKENIQVVLTTHSPFLVSDLPKHNLLFLKKDSEGLTTVIHSNEITGETFGGNIGELYLDAFFLDGSLISQFALKKINRLIDDILERKRQGVPIPAHDKLLVELIGEDLIKHKLQEILNDKNN